MIINVTRYKKSEIHAAIDELEKRGYALRSDIKRVTKDGKRFTHDGKVPEFKEGYTSVKYQCQMVKEETMS